MNGLAERLARNEQLVGGLGVTAQARNGNEIVQLANVHGFPPLWLWHRAGDVPASFLINATARLKASKKRLREGNRKVLCQEAARG